MNDNEKTKEVLIAECTEHNKGGKNGLRISHWSFGCGHFSVWDYLFGAANIIKGGIQGLGNSHRGFSGGYFSIWDYLLGATSIIVQSQDTGRVVGLLGGENAMQSHSLSSPYSNFPECRIAGI